MSMPSYVVNQGAEMTQRRPRPLLARVIKQARKAGLDVIGATCMPDGSVTLRFADAQNTSTGNSAKADESSEELRKLV